MSWRSLATLAVLAATTAAQQIETTDDGGICLAASGPITVAKLDAYGNKGTPESVVLASELKSANNLIEKLQQQRIDDKKVIDDLRSELTRVEGLFDGFGVKFDESEGNMKDIETATQSFKDSIEDLVATGFEKQNKLKMDKEAAKRTFATAATVNTQVAQMGQRIAELQELVERTSSEKLPRCQDPKDPKNGKVEHQQPGAGKEPLPFIPGVTIHYKCDAGYGIKGAKPGSDEKAYERVCYPDGTWASVADKSKLTGDVVCEACQAAKLQPIDYAEYYRNTQGARWGGRDFRSGNPGQESFWYVGPLSVSGVRKVTFEYEYVAGYSWNCGHSKGLPYKDCSDNEDVFSRYQDGAVMQVYVADAADPENTKSLVYDSGKLIDYPYDNCCAKDDEGEYINGCWGDVDTAEDGCYSPPVSVSSTLDEATGQWSMVENSEGEPGQRDASSRNDVYPNLEQQETDWLKTAKAIQFTFKFTNNRRNMHLNPHHLKLQVLGEVYDPVNRACRD